MAAGRSTADSANSREHREGEVSVKRVMWILSYKYSLLLQLFAFLAFGVSLAWRPRLCAQVLSRCTSQDVFQGARVLDSTLLHFGERLSTCLLGAGAAMTPRTGKDQDTIRADLMRDNFMSAEEVRRLTSLGFDGCIWYASAACGNRHRKAKDYGLIDQGSKSLRACLFQERRDGG